MTTTYQYDAEDRLTQVVTPTDVIQYQYDGFGRRISKTVNGVVARYVYGREDILFEFDENDQIKARYTHGPGIDEPISVDKDTDADGTLDTTYYYHYDGLGSVTTLTDSSGNIVQTYVYDAFGKIAQQTGSVENTYTYTGREWDAEAGLYYYRARYYDSTLGRFINGDPIGFAGGDVNFYAYVQNNPVNFFDPWGLIRPDFFDKDFCKRNKAGTQAFIEAFNEYNKGRSKKLKCDMNEAYEAYQEDVGKDHTRPPLPSPIEYSLLIKGLSELIGALVADYTKYGVGTTVDYGRAMYEGIKASQNYTSP